MSNELLAKNFAASGAIGKNLIVKANADGTVSVAAAATDALFGVNAELDVDDGERGDIYKAGIVDVIYGGAVAAGDPITSDANGKAVKAAPAAGANVRLIGFAEVAGVAGDVGSIRLAPGVMQG